MWTRIFLALLLSLLAACDDPALLPAAQGPAPRTINQPDAKVLPKITLQFGHRARVEAVAWINDGRNLVSVDDKGVVVFWDVAKKAIIDYAHLPTSDWVGFWHFGKTDDPGKLPVILAVYEHDDRLKVGADALCPAEALRENDWCTFSIDLATRKIAPDRSVPIPEKDFYRIDEAEAPTQAFPESPEIAPSVKWRPSSLRGDLEQGDGWAGIAEAAFSQPDCTDSQHCHYGILLEATDNSGKSMKLLGGDRLFIRDVDISPDGRQLFELQSPDLSNSSTVFSIDLTDTSRIDTIPLPQEFDGIRAIGPDSYILASTLGDYDTEATFDGVRDERCLRLMPCRHIPRSGIKPDWRADPTCARKGNCPLLPTRLWKEPLGGGDFIGIGGDVAGCKVDRTFADCKRGEPGDLEQTEFELDPYADGFARFHAAAGTWRHMDQPDWGEERITSLALSPDGKYLAVLTEKDSDTDEERTLWLRRFTIQGDGLADETTLMRRTLGPNDIGDIFEVYVGTPGSEIAYSSDGTMVAVSVYTQKDLASSPKAYDLFLAHADGSGFTQADFGHSQTLVPFGTRMAFELESGQITDMSTGRVVVSVDKPEILVRAGYIERANLILGASDDGTIQFWDAAEGTTELTLYILPGNSRASGNGFFALLPGGRYDTNLGPDMQRIRWLMPDRPWTSLSPQTFMRDFFEPGLVGRFLDCREAGNCREVFRDMPSMEKSNRTLPEVRITDIRPGADPAQALVTVEVTPVEDGGEKSGAYNPRLFRNGRLVAMGRMTSDPAIDPDDDDLTAWRKANDVGDRRKFQFLVPLPTGRDTEKQVFSAYAFNEDRIKSETAEQEYVRRLPVVRQPKAYIVTIGIDAYDTARFQLNYAAADARLLNRRLADIPNYEVHRIALYGERRPGGGRVAIDKATIDSVFVLLNSGGDREKAEAILAAKGIDASGILPATPDDLVIVSFSGHGWADRDGNFYLLPSDARWRPEAEKPDLPTLVSIEDLVRYFEGMQASDIALIIDACHSAASVDNGRFKAGPLGDSGLGQLAYDKGLLVLAATQANDVARENADLKQGLLTYVLGDQGLTESGGEADRNGDGSIHLAEWLEFAVDRMPEFSRMQNTRSGSGVQAFRDIGFSDEGAAPRPTPVQKPSLFNFNGERDPVILRNLASS